MQLSLLSSRVTKSRGTLARSAGVSLAVSAPARRSRQHARSTWCMVHGPQGVHGPQEKLVEALAPIRLISLRDFEV